MRPEKNEKIAQLPTSKIEIELESKLIEQLNIMEKHSKISRHELVAIALKRFISTHKDYFPEDYTK